MSLSDRIITGRSADRPRSVSAWPMARTRASIVAQADAAPVAAADGATKMRDGASAAHCSGSRSAGRETSPAPRSSAARSCRRRGPRSSRRRSRRPRRGGSGQGVGMHRAPPSRPCRPGLRGRRAAAPAPRACCWPRRPSAIRRTGLRRAHLDDARQRDASPRTPSSARCRRSSGPARCPWRARRRRRRAVVDDAVALALVGVEDAAGQHHVGHARRAIRRGMRVEPPPPTKMPRWPSGRPV